MIELRNYKEEYIEDQVRLGYEATRDWITTGQLPVESIKRAYTSNENFTADTRHYAFKGNEMVGYVISAIDREIDGVKEASMQYPKIPSKDKEIEKLLMEKTVTTLQEKGADILRTRIEINDTIKDEMLSFVKEYDFEFEHYNEFKRALFDIDQFDVENFESELPIEEYDHKSNPEELKAFLNEINVRDPFIEHFFRSVENERFTTHLVIRKEGKIIAHGTVLILPEEYNTCILDHVKVKDNTMEKEFDALFKTMLKIIKKQNREKNQLYVPFDIEGTKELYANYGIELVEIWHYKKDLKK